MSVTRILAVWMMGAVLCTACSSDDDGGSDDSSGSTDSGQTGGGADAGGGTTPDTAGEGTGADDDLYPLFGLERSEICGAWCAQYEACLPEAWAENGQTPEVCVQGCQETLDNAVASQNVEGRENCPPSIDSLYACQAQTCEDFQAGWSPDVEWVNCGRIEQQFLDECVL